MDSVLKHGKMKDSTSLMTEAELKFLKCLRSVRPLSSSSFSSPLFPFLFSVSNF